MPYVSAATANPVVLEFLRQSFDIENPRAGYFELGRLYDANPDCTMAPPFIWKFMSKAVHGRDPLPDAEVDDGKIYVDPVTAINYAVMIGELAGQFDEFIEESNETGIAEAIAIRPTPEWAFFALALTLFVNSEEGHPMAPIEAVSHLLGLAKVHGATTERKLLAALFGNEPPPMLTLVGV